MQQHSGSNLISAWGIRIHKCPPLPGNTEGSWYLVTFSFQILMIKNSTYLNSRKCSQILSSSLDMPIMIVGLFSYTSTITNCALSRVRALDEDSEESVFCLKKHRQGFLLRSHLRSSSPTCTLNVAVVLASILMPLLY